MQFLEMQVKSADGSHCAFWPASRNCEDELHTRNPRYQIYAKKAGLKQADIAILLDRSGSTISRELSRNCGDNGYRPKQAYAESVFRHAINARKVGDETWEFARDKLLQQWSPEQIRGHADISLEAVYKRS